MTRLVLLGAVTVVGYGNPLEDPPEADLGAPSAKLRHCLVIDAASERLACYDALFQRQQRLGDPGKWVVKKLDVAHLLVSLQAEREITGWPNRASHPRLVLRCQEARLWTYIATGFQPDAPFDQKSIAIKGWYRGQRPQEHTMLRSQDDQALFFVDSEALFAELLRHDRFLVEFTPLHSATTTIEFDLRGLAVVAPQVQALCPIAPP